MHPVLVLRAIANIEGKYSILPMPLNLRTRADVFVANLAILAFPTRKPIFYCRVSLQIILQLKITGSLPKGQILVQKNL